MTWNFVILCYIYSVSFTLTLNIGVVEPLCQFDSIKITITNHNFWWAGLHKVSYFIERSGCSWSCVLGVWGDMVVNAVYIKCIEHTAHLSVRRRRACVCLHPLAVVKQPCPTPCTRATHEWAGPWVSGPQSNQRLVKQPLAGGVSQWRAPPSGRQPIECAQNVGTWIPAHVDARKLPRERASKDTSPWTAGRCVCERAEAGRPDAASVTECILTDLSCQSRR